MKNLTHKKLAVQIGILLTSALAAQASSLYNDSTTDTGNSLTFVNGVTIGNEVNLGAGINTALVTDFSFEIYSALATFAGANVQMEAFLYKNDGPPFNTYPTPNTVYYDSGKFSLQTPQQSTGGTMDAVTLNFSGVNVIVGNDLTLAVVVTGLASADKVGVELFDPATTGSNHGDYWYNNNGAGWALLTNSVPTDFGARINGTPNPAPGAAPDAASTAVLLGAGLSGLGFLRRKMN
jgi:hypothetical protein